MPIKRVKRSARIKPLGKAAKGRKLRNVLRLKVRNFKTNKQGKPGKRSGQNRDTRGRFA